METEQIKYKSSYTGTNEIISKVSKYFDGQDVSRDFKKILELAESEDPETVKALQELYAGLRSEHGLEHVPEHIHSKTKSTKHTGGIAKEVGKITAQALLHGVTSNLIRALMH